MNKLNRSFWSPLALIALSALLAGACLIDDPDDAAPATSAGDTIGTFPAGDETTTATQITTWRRFPVPRGHATEPDWTIEGSALERGLVATITVRRRGDAFDVDVSGPFPATGSIDPVQSTAATSPLLMNPVLAGALRDFAAYEAASAEAEDESPGLLFALTAAEQARYKSHFACMSLLARASYTADGVVPADSNQAACGQSTFEIVAQTDVAKIWRETGPGVAHNHFIIGFAGTRFPNVGDILRDIQSAGLGGARTSVLVPGFLIPGRIVGGFWNRYQNQAQALDLRTRLAAWGVSISLARLTGGRSPVHISLVGHSLGAAAATIAAYDVRVWRDVTIPVHYTDMPITAYVFNPPRTGNAPWAQAYVENLSNRASRWALYQFTGAGDPVQDAPPFSNQPFWNTAPNATTPQAGRPAAGIDVGYCPQYHRPIKSSGGALGNHDLRSWAVDITSIPEAQLECMVRALILPSSEPPQGRPDPEIRYYRGELGSPDRWLVELRQEIPRRLGAGLSPVPVRDSTVNWKVEYNVFFRGNTSSNYYRNAIGRTSGNFEADFETGGRLNQTGDIGIQDGQWHELEVLRAFKSPITTFSYVLDLAGDPDVTIRGALVNGGSLTGRAP